MSGSEVANLDEARRRKADTEPLGYLPGVAPFDRSNPAHVKAWNAIHQLGWAEQRAARRDD